METEIARAVPGVPRGCGKSRTEGGVYVESGTGPGGSPLESFIVDRPVPFEVDHKLGVELREYNGKYHIFDHVGAVHYPYPCDVLEEGRRFGFSRKVAKNIDFSKLEPGSRILLVHSRAILENAAEIQSHYNPDVARMCAYRYRTGSDEHLKAAGPCSRDWYVFAPPDRVDERSARFWRHGAVGFEFEIFPPNPEAPVPQWRSGIIASVPITNISVIKARDGSHMEALERLRERVKGINVEENDG